MLLSYREAVIVKIYEEDENIAYVEVKIDEDNWKAINYNKLTGKVSIGDTVIVNTTAVELSLGTGGLHFIIFNYSNKSKNTEGQGHIMKLRYTPQQIRCFAAEEENSPYHEVFLNFKSLDGHLFILGSLHSMLAPIVAMIKYLDEDTKINYIMTDGGSLPIDFSNTVRELKAKKLIENTITIGHAFGGDLECTNIYTGLITAKEILKGDISIITMGPGIVGTGTKYGFSGIEQGYILDAINTLGGTALFVPRISFKDSRERHRGISHHTKTVLSEIAKTSGTVVFPILDESKLDLIKKQIELLDLDGKHNIIYRPGNNINKAMEKYQLDIKTMGRNYTEDREYFLALGAAGNYAMEFLIREA